MVKRIILLSTALALLVSVQGAWAQDLEPRAFSPVPIGMNFGVLGYGYGTGNVFFDQSLPIQNASGKIENLTLGYLRTLNFFGATSKLAAVVPFAWGDYEALWLDEPASASRRGFADPLVSFAVNFLGSPARTMQEIASYRENTVVGASVVATIPIGQYDPTKLINLGSNRWAIRGRLGGAHTVGGWHLELAGEIWAFTKNPEAFGESYITQDPILAIQFNAIYQFKRGFWLGLGYGYGEGGQTQVNGVEKDTSQENKRFGGTLVFPVTPKNSLKFTYLNSLSTVVGADFDRLGVDWQVRWGGGI